MDKLWPVVAGVLWTAAVLLHFAVVRTSGAPGSPLDVVLVAASVGHRSVSASTAWALTVLHFSSTKSPDPYTIEQGSLQAHALDPTHSVTLAYGSGMLHSLNSPVAARRLLTVGSQSHPGDPWFPWALRMSTQVYPEKSSR